MSDDRAYAPDGTPVAVFRALPAGDAPARIHAAVGDGACILDLGCGAGRLAHPLADLGHLVVGVDLSPEMLAGVRVPCVCADIAALPTPARFDAVLLASYLVNSDPALLDVCARHVKPGGYVVVQRFSPDYVRDAIEDDTTVGDITIGVRDFDVAEHDFRFRVTYAIGDTTWESRVDAVFVEQANLTRGGLRFERWLDDFEVWALLRADA